MRSDAKTYKNIKETIKANSEQIFKVSDLPKETDPQEFYPSPAQLHSHRAFGKNNMLKSYKVIPNLTNIVVILWKTNFLTKDESVSFAKIQPEGEKC